MRGLFFKIFAIFWVAQSLIVIISTTLIVRQHFPNPGVVAESLDSNLRFTAQRALRSYETGGCAAFAADTQRFEPSGAELLDAQGSLLCSTPGAPVMTGLRPHFNERVESRQLSANHYLWLVPLTLPSGARASYVWFQPPSMRRPPKLSSALYHFMFPQLPVAIAAIDPKRAVELVEAMPDDPDLNIRGEKNAARLAVANVLGRAGEARFRKFQGSYLHLWVPDTEDHDPSD